MFVRSFFFAVFSFTLGGSPIFHGRVNQRRKKKTFVNTLVVIIKGIRDVLGLIPNQSLSLLPRYIVVVLLLLLCNCWPIDLDPYFSFLPSSVLVGAAVIVVAWLPSVSV